MRDAFAVIAGAISFLCVVPYLRDMLRRKTHPNIVSWITWALISGIVTVVALTNHYWQTAFFTGLGTLGSLSVVALGLKYGVKHYTQFDIGCQVAALIGIILWRLTNDAGLAVLIVAVTDTVGALPTMRHAWLKPFEETWQTFAIDSLAALISLLSLAKVNFTSSGYQFFILSANLMIVLIVILRRQTALAAT